MWRGRGDGIGRRRGKFSSFFGFFDSKLRGREERREKGEKEKRKETKKRDMEIPQKQQKKGVLSRIFFFNLNKFI